RIPIFFDFLRRADFRLMHVLFQCPACETSQRTTIVAGADSFGCRECHWSCALQPDDLDCEEPHKCLVCGCADLWRQKDFPRRAGLALVVLGAILSTIAWAYHLPATALGVLIGLALVDLVLFTFMKDVLVCYRCAAR